MLDTPFLTELDSRAAVKGSRDPLGLQQIWTRFGRHVVGNLTTVSTSVRDFTTLLLGYYFANDLADESDSGGELHTFLRWEQLAAYARAAVNKDLVFRGTERVQANLQSGKRVTISAEQTHQILSNQKIYGLWGLYTVPARASGLLDGDPPHLTSDALELVERHYLPILATGAGRDARHVRDVLCANSFQLDVNGKHAKLLKAVGDVLAPKLRAAERDAFRNHLLHGGPGDETNGRQRQFAELLTQTLAQPGWEWSPATVNELAVQAGDRSAPQSLAFYLDRIATCESVLAPVSMLFAHLLGLDGKTVAEVAERLRDEWGDAVPSVRATDFRALRGEIAGGDADAGDRWVGIAHALEAGDYPRLIDLLLAQNKAVMDARNGGPWVARRDEALHVHVRDESGSLPKRAELPNLWRFPYFMYSLRAVAAALRGE
jgi:hypothetical protein